MREILFRGILKYDTSRYKRGQWCFGDLVRLQDGNDGKPHIYGYGEVFPKTIGQFTGLTDKNGKKIFEGDVFRMEDDMIAVIIFKDGCFRLQVYGLYGTFTESGYDEDDGGYGVIECEPIDLYYIHYMQVIGNIHDNPELLERRC